MIPKEYVGKKFLSHVEEIRYTRGGVASNQVVIHRDATEGNREFVEEPPVFVFENDADIDIDRLLRTGAITLYTERSAPSPKTTSEGG